MLLKRVSPGEVLEGAHLPIVVAQNYTPEIAIKRRPYYSWPVQWREPSFRPTSVDPGEINLRNSVRDPEMAKTVLKGR